MQTFLPYSKLEQSASCLDAKRLNNQINETTVILRTILGTYAEGKGWPNHPVTKMWAGHEKALACYQAACCIEYTTRMGQAHTGYFTLMGLKYAFGRIFPVIQDDNDMPSWLGDDAFHAAHRSNLLRKDKTWYGQFGWSEPDNLPYIYPEPS